MINPGRPAPTSGKMRFQRPPLFENLDGLLTVNELAKVLGMKPRTIREWVQLGKVPYRRLDRSIRFSKADIALWVDNQGGVSVDVKQDR